jgi:hypothetical protein
VNPVSHVIAEVMVPEGVSIHACMACGMRVPIRMPHDQWMKALIRESTDMHIHLHTYRACRDQSHAESWIAEHGDVAASVPLRHGVLHMVISASEECMGRWMGASMMWRHDNNMVPLGFLYPGHMRAWSSAIDALLATGLDQETSCDDESFMSMGVVMRMTSIGFINQQDEQDGDSHETNVLDIDRSGYMHLKKRLDAWLDMHRRYQAASALLAERLRQSPMLTIEALGGLWDTMTRRSALDEIPCVHHKMSSQPS